MPVVVDTSFLIDHARGKPSAAAALEKLLAAQETLLIPSIVAAEFLGGLAAPARGLAVLSEAGDVSDFTAADAVAAAEIARDAVAQGRFPGWLDVMIAGFAKARGDLPIVTANARHFPAARTIAY